MENSMNQTLNQDRNSGFKKKLIATAVASALLGGNHFAQAQTDGTVEEVVVTGIRASLERSMDIKRTSQGVVDAISAEDIGKMPDTNLAESLQRITGVSIDRSLGEGSKITVRGLGPDFNLVLLNSRQMPTSNLEGTSVSASRSFDFANIAAESVAGVDVYKTSRANIATGGMGSTVNVRTARPLDAPGLKFTAGVKGVYDESSQDPSLTPEISGIFSNTNEDETVGVAVSMSRQVRDGGYRQVNVPNGWHTQEVDADYGGMSAASIASQTVISNDDKFLRPQNIEYNFTEFHRERDNSQVVLQFKPVESVKATLDYTYSELEINSETNTTNVWFWEGEEVNTTDSVWALGSTHNEGAGGNVWYPLVYTQTGGDDTVFGVGNFGQKNTNDSVGLNLEWTANDNLTLGLDYHDSTAESKANSPYGNSNVIQVAAFGVRSGGTVDFTQDFAALGLRTAGFDPENPTYTSGDAVSRDLLQPTGSSLRNSIFENDIQQSHLYGKYAFDDSFIKSVDFGIGKTDNGIHRGIMTAQRDNWGNSFGTPDDLRDWNFTGRSITGDFPSATTSGTDAYGNTFTSFDRGFIFSFDDVATDVVAISQPGVGAPISTGDPATPTVWPCPDRFCVNQNWTTDQSTDESYTSAYVQGNFEFELGFAVLGGSLGVRYEETDVESSAKVPVYEGIQWIADNEFALVTADDQFENTLYTASYDHVLPNLDLNLKFENDVVVRTSYSETISRANYNHISGGVTMGLIRQDSGDASRGDPTLVPTESQNIDLSVEWYFDDASYVSLGAFTKNVDNFIGVSSGADPENLFDLRNPWAGPRAQAARDDGAVTDTEVRDYIIANYPDTVDPVNPQRINQVDSGPLMDPLMPFQVTKPINNEKARITGIEFASQYTWDFGGGLQFNYTAVDSDAEYDVTEFTAQFAMTGLSDTANLVAFYENDSFQVRLAYNWRDAFLINPARDHLNPEFVEEYSQVDMNVSYDLSDNFSVFLEGINITNETTRTYSRYEGALQSATELGARYNIGARYTF
jgi:TonB-dependent receptor